VLAVKTLVRRTLPPLLVAALACIGAGNSSAYVLSTEKWTLNRTVVMHLSLGGTVALDDGFTSFNQSAADALNIWNQYLAHLKFSPRLASTMPQIDGDADNSVFFSSTIYGDTFGSSTVAVTLISSRSNVTTETDVIFNSRKTWNSYRGPLVQDLDFHRVALHEFGHVVGLDHPDEANQTVTAIMNSRVSNLDELQADDINGAHALYDQGPTYLSSIPAPNLVNLSTRALVGPGSNALIGGFIVQGSQPATIILRGIGNSLAAFGVSNALEDPVIELRNQNGTLLSESDDWIIGSNAETIASYRLDPTNSLESALLRSLTAGNYTVIVRGFGATDTGTGLVELYDLHTTNGRAGNISSRGQVRSGNDAMIAGFIIGGSQPKEVVVRAIGPSLAQSGVAGALADPTLTLVAASGTTIASNDNWQSDPNATRVSAVNLAPSQPVESAINRTLSPGSYTAIVRGVNNATGVGLVEVYDLGPPPP